MLLLKYSAKKCIFVIVFSNKIILTTPVAQWIEQKFPKLLVGGSIPLGGTNH